MTTLETLFPLSSNRLSTLRHLLLSTQNILPVNAALAPRALLNINIQRPLPDWIIPISTHTNQPRPLLLPPTMEFLARLSAAGMPITSVDISTRGTANRVLS